MNKPFSKKFLLLLVPLIIMALTIGVLPVSAQEEPGTVPGTEIVIQDDQISPNNNGPSPTPLQPVVTETGLISLSIDGLGTDEASGIIQVEKPAGATVRKAYMVAASTGFSSRKLANGDVKINGVGVTWNLEIPSSISSWNHWADVTSIVKTTIDAALAGRVDFTITEVNTGGIDGEILAVIFDDPNQTVTNTIILLFGAQDIAGETFNIGLAAPLDKSDPYLILDLSLGISFGYQPGDQYNIVKVNGTRMSTSAGGQDDRYITNGNGALLTVGGLDDSNANPPPFAPASDIRIDDELYDLLPFVNTGDTAIAVFTENISEDDNIFFAALFLGSVIAIIEDNGPPIEVGGDVSPVNKIALLAPWIALAAVIIAGATIVMRRRLTQS